MKLEKLYQIIVAKKNANNTASYTASLFKEGKDRIIQKVGEEAIEVVIAAKNEKKTELVYEIADFFYHLTALMVLQGITFTEVEEELQKRHKKK